jgi:D-alanyl-lipoteichoic acid acyltransferase DltB (MBOAT superfamily)
VAGPIVRASEFMSQLYRPFRLSRRLAGLAVFWILNGLIKKIVLSDYLAINFIDRVFENPLLFSGFENLFALFAYSLQVYADFSGYTDIAIGIAMLLGFYLPQNFNSPYKAQTPQDFWRRWHMSLSRWLKSYLYIPLGGNRTILGRKTKNKLKAGNFNSFITML